MHISFPPTNRIFTVTDNYKMPIILPTQMAATSHLSDMVPSNTNIKSLTIKYRGALAARLMRVSEQSGHVRAPLFLISHVALIGRHLRVFRNRTQRNRLCIVFRRLEYTLCDACNRFSNRSGAVLDSATRSS